MRRSLVVLIALLVSRLASADGFVAVGGGGGGGASERLLAFDAAHAATTNAQCSIVISSLATSGACDSAPTTRFVQSRAATITRWEVVLLESLAGTTNGCALTLATTGGDVSTTTKPGIAEEVVAGHTKLESAGDVYSEAVTGASVTAGQFIQVRFNDLAAGSSGNDGSCAGIGPADIMWFVYGR